MVERMKYVNIMGPMDRLDHAVNEYLSRHEIQLEYTIRELPNEKGLSPLPLDNPYTAALKSADGYLKAAGISAKPSGKRVVMGVNQAVNVIDYVRERYEKAAGRSKELAARREACGEALGALMPFSDLNMKVNELERFAYIGYQFGKMPISGFKQFETFLYNEDELILFSGRKDESSVYCVYFAPAANRDKIDSLFSSLHFEKVNIPLEVCGERLTGTIAEACASLDKEIEELTKKIMADERDAIEGLENGIGVTSGEIAAAYRVLRDIEFYYDIRRYAAKTPNDFYIFVGWMTEREAQKLVAASSDDESVVVIVEDNHEALNSKPPTKLRNILPFRPFEFFVNMYGLPTYGEMDPTGFVAFTYTLLFGIMFGDLGQGLTLAVIGLYMWKKMKLALGKIMLLIGCSSAFFGVMFGSVFGYDKLPAILIKPAENSMMVLTAAVIMGVWLIIVPIIFNCMNAVKRGLVMKALFAPNGFAGLYFYVTVAVCAGLKILKIADVPMSLIIALVALPFFLIMFRDVLTRALTGRKPAGDTIGMGARAASPAPRPVITKHRPGIGMFILETLIEQLEVMLTYFTNTVSFVRVGAFALSHASMMGVVMMLSETAKGGYNPVVLIIGNVFVIGLEGLIVGIQVLRLEFYEVFSRFYEGGGRPFTPYKLDKK